ncbi:unnamed protein product [Somion occarium]|uniref:Uncharacterized protein n=1 Tax=Somion occarium TaxID=3059160 RepID=A0ABP1CPS3_9APHY
MCDMRSRFCIPFPLLFVALLSLESPDLSRFTYWVARRHPFWALSYSAVFANAELVNRTVDDSSSEIVYTPATSWHSSANQCATCLAPSSDLAYQGTWHDGTHIIPTFDADDLNENATNDTDDQPSGKPSPPSPPPPPPTQVKDDDEHEHDDDDDDDDNHGDDDNDGKDKDKGKGRGKGGLDKRASRSVREREKWFRRQQDADDNPFFVPKLDSDDEGFVDTPVLANFNFTGSAVYVFGLIPLFPAAANNTPTFVNLTYTLDSQPAGDFSHSGTQSPVSPTPAPSAFQQSVPIFARTGLPEGFHALTINVGPDSVFLLDYIIYSQDDGFGGGGNDTDNAVSTTWSAPGSSGTSGAGSSAPSTGPTQSTSTSTKSHNVATFAGAVGGSVGLLAVLSLSLALSLYRRRRAAQRRDRQYRAARTRRSDASIGESFHTDASEDGPPMQGPAPFIPRYFPGTVPTAPPPYVPSNSPEPTDSLLAPSTSIHSPLASVSWNTYRPVPAGDPGDSSYADRPPPTPPPIDDGYFAPPPTFGEAIASPVPAILSRLSGMPVASQATSPRPPSLTSISTLPSRAASRSSATAQSSNDTSPRGSALPENYTRVVSSQASNSSLRGAHSSLSSSAQPLIPVTPPEIHSTLSEPLADPPPSSHSEVPPSIPPPIEVLQAEQGQIRRTSDEDTASR